MRGAIYIVLIFVVLRSSRWYVALSGALVRAANLSISGSALDRVSVGYCAASVRPDWISSLSLTPRAPIRGSGSDDRVGSLLAFFVAEWHAVKNTSWRRDQGPLINAEIRREEVHFVELG